MPGQTPRPKNTAKCAVFYRGARGAPLPKTEQATPKSDSLSTNCRQAQSVPALWWAADGVVRFRPRTLLANKGSLVHKTTGSGTGSQKLAVRCHKLAVLRPRIR